MRARPKSATPCAGASSKLYNTKAVDAPDMLLTNSPAPKNIVDALRVLLDVLFPGKLGRCPVAARNWACFRSAA